jgi:hypothetical protein
MTKFQNEPFQKVIIKNLVHEDLDSLLHQCLSNYRPEAFWVDGMIVSTSKCTHSAGGKDYEDMVKGVQYFQKIVFVKFPKYVPSITQKNCVKYVRLLNYSNNTKFKELAKWIKQQPIWNTIPEKTQEEIEIDE